MKNFSRFLALMLALCLALPFAALAEDVPGATAAPSAAAEIPAEAEATEAAAEDPVFFTLDGREYRKSEVDQTLYNLYSNGYVDSMTDYATGIQYMIEDAVLIAKIAELGYDQFTEEEEAAFRAEAQSDWDDAIDSYVEYFLTEDTEEARAEARRAGEAYYTAYGFSVDTLVESLKLSAGFELLQAQMLKDVPEATEEEIKAVFEEYAAQDQETYANDFFTYEMYQKYGYESWYKPEGFRGIIHILLEVDQELLDAYENAQAMYEETLSGEEAKEGEEAAEPVTREDVDAALQAVLDSRKDAIDDIYARLEKGESFQTLIAEYNTDLGMTGDNLENGYEVHPESTMTWIPEFVEGAFSEKMQKPGDVSDPVVANYGIHILYYLRDIPGGFVEMTDEIRAQIADYLNNQQKSSAYYEQLYTWVDDHEVVYNTEAITAAGGAVPQTDAE